MADAPAESDEPITAPSSEQHLVPVSAELLQYHQSLRPKPQQFGAPRRFGIGTILIVMGAASLLLAFLIAWGAHPVVVLHVVGFTTLIGFAQVFLFEGKDPRKASLVAGLVICPVYWIGLGLYITVIGVQGEEEIILIFFLASFVFGPLLGYLAGGVVGGIFLLMDVWEKKFGRQDHAQRIYDPFAPEPLDEDLLGEDEEISSLSTEKEG